LNGPRALRADDTADKFEHDMEFPAGPAGSRVRRRSSGARITRLISRWN